MKIAIHQPNYLPWAGYFYKLLRADIFVFFDTVQFPRGKSYCSRVKIKTPSGTCWLTVPVRGKGELLPIMDVQTAGRGWVKKHLGTLIACYAKASYFNDYYPELERIYSEAGNDMAGLNMQLIIALAKKMGARTAFVRASEIGPARAQTGEYIINLVKALNGTVYLTGQGAGTRRYLDEQGFQRVGVQVEMFHYSETAYRQLWGGDFVPGLSVVDVLFNTGPGALELIMSGGRVP